MDALAFASTGYNPGFMGRGSAPTHLISEERKKSANCFTVDQFGEITVGIILSLDHPVTGGKPALVLGETTYVSRDIVGYRGCLYERIPTGGLVRRAIIGEFELPSGKSFPLLRKLDGEPQVRLVHVNFGMPENARLRPGLEPLYAGVRGGSAVAWEESEVLLEVKKDDVLVIFYPDGRVTRIAYDGFENFSSMAHKAQMLDGVLALNERLDFIGEELETVDELDELARARKEDWALHQYAAMLRMVRVSSPLHTKLVHTLDELHVRGQQFRPGVTAHFRSALQFVGDRTIYAWVVDENLLEKEASLRLFAESARKYDGRLHGLITEAIQIGNFGVWETACHALVRASEEGQLRPGVQKRFTKNCPPGCSEFSDAVGKLPVADSEGQKLSSGMSRRKKTPEEKKAEEARRLENRQKRIEAQPAKGPSGGGGGNNHSHGKKGDKKKK